MKQSVELWNVIRVLNVDHMDLSVNFITVSHDGIQQKISI